MSRDKHQAAGPPSETGERGEFDAALAAEGLDDELLRQLGHLLEMELVDPPRRTRKEPLRRRAEAHIVVARLSFEARLSDRAEVEAHAALALAPDDEAALGLLAAIHHARGELGAAITLHSEMAARAGGEPSALATLGRLFEASMREESPSARAPHVAPEAGPFTGLSELEHAFRVAFAGNLQGALRIVDRVAARARTEARGVYKLAMLERAFLLEQAQDVRGAITTLERLADEPGLASDVERLLCLSLLYEREGTPERIRRALRAVRYAYLVTRRPTLLRRIARLVGKLGHTRLAELFEARYLEVFRRRMHVLSLREAARALPTVYVPPEGLSVLPFGHRAVQHLFDRIRDRKRPEHRRRAAALALWSGDAARAEAMYAELDKEGQTTPVDLLYLADALEALGEHARARLARRRGVAGLDRPDAAALARLLGHDDANAEDAREALGSPERLAEAASVLRARRKTHPEDRAAVLSLARLAEARDEVDVKARYESHARALADAARTPRPYVLAAAAWRRGGEVRGVIHELWADSRRTKRGRGGLDEKDVLGSVAPDLRARAVSIFQAVRAFVRSRYPHRVDPELDDRRFLLRFTKDDEPSSGDSAGLPIAVAFASVMLGLSTPSDVAFSGAVICDAHDVLSLARIGDVDAKIEGAYERRLSRIVLPAQNRDDVTHAERVPRKIAEHMVVFARTLDEVLEAMFPELV
ncbi:S16 family serine protease [Polyangium sorediatum]|uniref:Lon proteolytic domain-containing protein n=1 Tax=Polyangium sorediatum TaxID=889274 RepID=A0ABT6P194_9BACT|nr:S16 family serine protease [Polyangium sorediatum]MDI1434369.1 hypothetical protein [Polyangium sorediatum]